jgi:hypothetical protein
MSPGLSTNIYDDIYSHILVTQLQSIWFGHHMCVSDFSICSLQIHIFRNADTCKLGLRSFHVSYLQCGSKGDTGNYKLLSNNVTLYTELLQNVFIITH